MEWKGRKREERQVAVELRSERRRLAEEIRC